MKLNRRSGRKKPNQKKHLKNPIHYGVSEETFHGSFRDEDPGFFSTDPDPAQLRKKIRLRIRLRIRPEFEMNKKYIYILGF